MTTASSHGRLHVRELRPEDADEVGRIALASYDAHGHMEGTYRDFVADPAGRLAGSTDVLVAELDGRVVGTVTFVLPEDEEWEGPPQPTGDAAFRVLAVAPEAEGRGVGRRLVEACIERARQHGCHRIVITSMPWMNRAHGLYRSLGFERRRDLDVRFPAGLGVAFTLDLSDEAPRRFAPPGPVPAAPPWYADVWQVDETPTDAG